MTVQVVQNEKKKSFCLLSTHQSKKYTEPSLFNVCKNHKPLARSSRNHLARHSERGEEDKEDRGRGGKTTSENGQAWTSASPRGQWKTGKMEETGCEVICGAPTTLAVKG